MSRGIAVVLHDAVAKDAPPDQLDVLVQADLASRALGKLGWTPLSRPCTLDLEGLRNWLDETRPAAAFNLVESLGGHGRLISVVPGLLEAAGVPYAGTPADAIFVTSHKILSKELMAAWGLPTPEWSYGQGRGKETEFRPGRWIMKSLWEHASFGLDASCVVELSSVEMLLGELGARRRSLGGEAFAERFIEGREFNLSVLAGEVLPPAEIEFVGFSREEPKIVGYAAKWDESSAVYRNTPRNFDFPSSDRSLLEELKRLASEAWRLFGLRGWARVDFRVDVRGRPWILELNANPCLSPDAGFMAAVVRAGLDEAEAVRRIMGDSGL